MNRFSPPRGSNMSAQGNALGMHVCLKRSPEGVKQFFQIGLSTPLQGYGLLSHSFPGRCLGLA